MNTQASLISEQQSMSGFGLAGRVRRRRERAGRPTCSLERLEALDAELARRAREAGRLRFEMGIGLDLLERSGGDHALGRVAKVSTSRSKLSRCARWPLRCRVKMLWCFEQVKLLSRLLGERTDADVVLGLVAESMSTLCGELPRSAIDSVDDDANHPQRAWEQELARMRAEAEARCETNFRHRVEQRFGAERMVWPDSPEAIDRQLRELACELAVREVTFGRTLDAFFSAEGWRRLGYATPAQYAREQLGTSVSSIKAKRWLAKRLGQLEFLTDALARGEVGYEAARLVAGVATRATVEAWVERAKERTLRHLREEVDVAELLARWCESSEVVPPSDAEVQRVQDLERAVVAGQISVPPPPGATTAAVTLRLRVRASTARDFRHWEALYLRHRGAALRTTTFLRFACELFADTWRPRPSDVAYAHIYERDRHRCQSPCCGRRDVTPPFAVSFAGWR